MRKTLNRLWLKSDWVVLPGVAIWLLISVGTAGTYHRPHLEAFNPQVVIDQCAAQGGVEVTAHYEVNDGRMQLKFDCEMAVIGDAVVEVSACPEGHMCFDDVKPDWSQIEDRRTTK